MTGRFVKVLVGRGLLRLNLIFTASCREVYFEEFLVNSYLPSG